MTFINLRKTLETFLHFATIVGDISYGIVKPHVSRRLGGKSESAAAEIVINQVTDHVRQRQRCTDSHTYSAMQSCRRGNLGRLQIFRLFAREILGTGIMRGDPPFFVQRNHLITHPG